jgi:hypothetical protein
MEGNHSAEPKGIPRESQTGAVGIIDGNLSDLKAALSDLEAEIGSDEISGAPVTEVSLAGLRRKAERNAACLKGAARGLRSARRRIAEVRAAATGLGAYDAQGQRLDAITAAARINRRF